MIVNSNPSENLADAIGTEQKNLPSASDQSCDTSSKDEIEAVDPDDRPRETISLNGQIIYGGAALGHSQMLSEGELEIPHFSIDKAQTRSEFSRLRAAVNTVVHEFEELLESLIENDDPAQARAFIELQCQIIQDKTLVSDTQDLIRDRLINAEWALSIRLDELRRSFEEIDDDYLAERIEDIAQVIERVQRVLTGRRRPADALSQTMGESSVILISEDLSPADILILKRRRDISVSGLIVEKGSTTSHSAILARSLEIPMLVGVTQAREHIQNDDIVFLNADEGTVLVNPDETLLPAFSRHIRQLNINRKRHQKLRSTPCATKDGVRVELMANIALPEDVISAVRHGAEGVGLFRSEFLFMNRPSFPSEDEQYETYLRVIRAMRDKPVTIRTMDLGGDKMPSDEALQSIGAEPDHETRNPALGRRAVRFCLDHPDIFKTQLRAILRAACDGNVRVMIPLISRVSEIRFVRTAIAQCQQELKDRGVKYAEHVPVGGMIEVPALAFCLPMFLRHLDFASVGTNDLVQYLLAVDRQNSSVNSIYCPLHPAVTQVLHDIIRTANRMKKEISVCGELASDPMYAKLLVGMGLRRLSMDYTCMFNVKEHMLAYTLDEAKTFARRLLRATTQRGIRAAIKAGCSGPGELESSSLVRDTLIDEIFYVRTHSN